MVQPELARSQPTASLPRPGLWGRALGGFFFLIALVCSGIGMYDASYAAGVTGTHGTLTVSSCWVKNAGGRSSNDKTMCGGTFRSDDGRITDDQANLTATLERGEKISVQRVTLFQADHWYVRTGVGETTRWLALFFGGWLIAAFGVAFATTGMFPRSGMQVVMISRAVSGTRGGAVRTWLVRGGLAGAAICLTLTWIW